jgi:DNA-binding FrmR family transcriptional regulator
LATKLNHLKGVILTIKKKKHDHSHTHSTHPAIIKRLKIANGHLVKIISMIEEGKPCLEVAQQMQAVSRAMENAKSTFIHDHIQGCLSVEGLSDKKKFTLGPEDAYGQRDDSLTREFARADFPPEMEPEVGMTIALQTPEGSQMPAQITHLDDEKLSVDLNHPLAGESLTFEIELVGISSTQTQSQDGCGCGSTGGASMWLWVFALWVSRRASGAWQSGSQAAA